MLLLFWQRAGEGVELGAMEAAGTSTATASAAVRVGFPLESIGYANAQDIDATARRDVAPVVAGTSTADLTLIQEHVLEMAAAGTSSAELTMRSLLATLVLAHGQTETVARSLRHPIPAKLVVEVLTPALVASTPT